MDECDLKAWEDWYVEQRLTGMEDEDYFFIGMTEAERQHYYNVSGIREQDEENDD